MTLLIPLLLRLTALFERGRETADETSADILVSSDEESVAAPEKE